MRNALATWLRKIEPRSAWNRPILCQEYPVEYINPVEINKMHGTTKATLAELEAANWFINVGKNDSQRAQFLSSWDDAVRSCSSPQWEEIRLEAANRFREKLAKIDLNRFRKWNELIKEIKPVVEALVDRKSKGIVEQYALPKAFIDVVRWDVLHLCMECEYADIVPPSFYAGQSYWYANGHFPCGWDGELPGGRPIVY
jgi:hypothetical protein